MRGLSSTWYLVAALLLSACTGAPDGLAPVEDFNAERYLGTWYEIARLDHRFERGLSRVSATYSKREDGGIRVLNRGFDADQGEWSEAEGRAYFTRGPGVGALKVSFFGPFYGGYNIIALDRDNYQWALVSGYNRDYLWLLARAPELPDARRQSLVDLAQEMGFATDQLIFVDH